MWAARCLWGLVVAALLIHFIPGQGYRSATSEGGLSQLFVTAAVMAFLLAFATVGALVASRVPGNPIGWLLLGSALAYTLATAATGLPAPHPSAPAWYTADADLAGQPLYTAGLALGFLTLLLFPTGSLPSRRWRWAGWLIGAGWLLFTIGQTFGPARLPDLPAPNPAAVGGSAGRVLGVLQTGQVLAVAGGVLACISLIVRFRRSESVVRKQIEWLAYAAGVVVAGIAVNALLQLRPHDRDPQQLRERHRLARPRVHPGRDGRRDPHPAPVRHRRHRQQDRRLPVAGRLHHRGLHRAGGRDRPGRRPAGPGGLRAVGPRDRGGRGGVPAGP